MPYTKVHEDWEDSPSTDTPITAAALEQIETGIATAQTDAEAAQSTADDAYAPGGTDVAVVDGGTGASTASGARTNLGLAIGTDVQAYSAALDAVSGTNTGDESVATDTAAGIVELATIAEVDTGTDAGRAITPAGLAGSALQTKVDGVATGATDDTTVDAHIADTSAAHAASAISVDSTNLDGTGTDVQTVLEEIEDQLDALGTLTTSDTDKVPINTIGSVTTINVDSLLSNDGQTLLSIGAPHSGDTSRELELYGTPGGIDCYSPGGSPGAPTQTGDTVTLSRLVGHGYTDGGAWTTSDARIETATAEAQTGSAQGQYVRGYVKENGTTTAVEAWRVSPTGQIIGLRPLGGIGYGDGAGGTVTQATDKTTGVTLNKVCGQITMNGAALANNTTVGFTLTNSAIIATDVVMVNIASGGTTNAYILNVTAVAAGSCYIQVRNTSGGSLSEALVLNFALIRGATV